MGIPCGTPFHAKIACPVIRISFFGSGFMSRLKVLHMASTLNVGTGVGVWVAVRVGAGVYVAVGVHVGGSVCKPRVGAGVVGPGMAVGRFPQAANSINVLKRISSDTQRKRESR